MVLLSRSHRTFLSLFLSMCVCVGGGGVFVCFEAGSHIAQAGLELAI